MTGAIVCGMLAAAGAAEAKTFEVTRANDPNPGKCKRNDCSLREAVRAANKRAGADTIVLSNRKRPYKLTIPNATPGVEEQEALTGDLDVTNDRLLITHRGKGKATIRGTDALGDRLFENFPGGPLELVKLRLTGGAAQFSGGGTDGAAINGGARVTVLRSILVGNHAENVGGAINMNQGALRIVRSSLLGNEADNTAGAIRSGDGPITIIRSRLQGNEAASDGGAIRLSSPGPVRVIKSTIAGNTSGTVGGGIQNDSEELLLVKDSTILSNSAADAGGGLHLADGPTRIVNSTIAGNQADANGGGIYANAALVDLNAVTVARNNSGADDPGPAPTTGGGIYMIDSMFAVRNSLIALNTVGLGGISGNDCEGETFTSRGNNLLSTKVECDGFTEPTDLERANPKIGPLAKNGGPTKTVALKKGSPAIGKAHRPSAPNRDQRGKKRDRRPDIGAFERGA